MQKLPTFTRYSCVRYLILLVATFLMGTTLVHAQTPQPANPIGTGQSLVPQFSALASSLISGVTYNVAISETPRGGANNQYQSFWVRAGLAANDLMPTNANRLTWNSGWTRNIRSGGYDGAVTSSTVGSPASLTPGKTYYWHIVGTNGTKSAQASFTVMSLPAQPTLTINNNLNRNLFEVSWNAVANVSRYELYRNNSLIYSGMGTAREVPVGSAGVNYTFMIKACNAAGCTSGSSSIGNFPVPPTTAGIQIPAIGGTANTIPAFAASATSLVSTASYTIAISESPRAGLNGQYVDFWSINGISSSALTAGNTGQITWSTNWVKRTRYGNPDGAATIVSNTSPSTLTLGKTYYWHIVAGGTNGGMSKSAEGRFVVVASSSSSVSSLSSSSSSSNPAVSLFDFNTQAPSVFNYPLTNSGVPTLGASQLVATTQGNLNVSNGAAGYSIPIELPPAVRDLKPNLSLNYNSRSGNGLMGVGWNLGGLSAITRCRTSFATEGAEAQKSNPRYTIGDRLCLDGQKLVVASSTTAANDATYWAAGTEYKTELDNFAKIVAYGSSANGGHGYFKVWTKDGRILTYGAEDNSQSSKIYATNQSAGSIKTWALDKVEDAYGNSYTITYDRDITTGEHYPLQINLGATGLVVFSYQSRTGQTPWGYDGGNKYQFTKILDKVTTYLGTTQSTPIKQYDINYKISATTNRELVETIQECGYESSAWKCAKPVTFDWQVGELGFESTPNTLVYTNNESITGVALFEDLNGDGYVDVLGENGIRAWGEPTDGFSAVTHEEFKHFLLINTVQGKAAITSVERTVNNKKYLDISLTRFTKGAALTSTYIASYEKTDSDEPKIFVEDLNNDGLTDLLIKPIYHEFSANQIHWRMQSSAVTFALHLDSDKYLSANREHRFLDVNADGLKDLTGIQTFESGTTNPQNYVTKMLNIGGIQFETSSFLHNASPTPPATAVSTGIPGAGGPRLVGSQGYWHNWIDINNDGHQDLLVQAYEQDTQYTYPKYKPTNWSVRIATGGTDTFASMPLVDTAIPVTCLQYTCGQYIFTYDYNKDGIEDFVLFSGAVGSNPKVWFMRAFYASHQQGQLAFINSGIDPFFNKLSNLAHDPVASPPVRVNVLKGDVNNDGLVDMIVSENNINFQAYLAKQQQPDLINKITDGFGAVTELAYSPLTGDANNGKPLYTPDTVAPIFPQQPVNRAMQVVKKVSVSNGKGGLNHSYFNYTGGVQDLFRGFGGFKSISITNTATNVNSTTEYRQNWPFTGRIKKQTLKDTAGKLISITDNSYALHSQNLRFPYLHYSLQKSYELSTTNESSPLSVSKSINTLDACGNVTEQNTKVGNGFSGVDVTGELSNQRTVNVYQYYGTPACNDDFLTRSTQEVAKAGNAGLKTVVTEFTPNSQGEVKTRTDFTGETIQQVTTYDRETNGVVNRITESAKDVDGSDEPSRITTFGNFVYGMRPQTITNAQNHPTFITYDYRFGSVKTETAIGLTTTNTYDALGRLQTQQTPDGSLTENITFYCSSAPVTCPTGAYYGVATRLTHASQSGKLGAPLSITFYDALQREVRSVAYSLDGKVINQATEYLANGYPFRISEPYATSGIYADTAFASAWNSYSSYDALGRANTIIGADGGSKTTIYATDVYGLKVTDNILVVKPVGGTETQTSSRVINPLGQVIKVEDALYNTVAYSYDAAGNLETTQINNNIATKIDMTHDLAGNKTYIKDPDAGVINFDYNGFGELRRQTWQKGIAGVEKHITYDYDKLGRQTSRIDKPATGSQVSYSWIWDTRQQGQLSTRTGNGFTEDYYYDGFSRLSRQVVTTSGLSGGEFGYAYDNFSRPEIVKYPNGFKIQRDYHAAGYQVQTRDITSGSKVLWALGNTLDARGHFNNQLWGNGVVTQTGFDNRSGRLTSIKSGRLGGTNQFNSLYGDIQNLSYSYDTLGNLAKRTTARSNATGVALENTTETYLYDKLNRVKTVITSGVFGRTQTFDYDTGGLGNLVNRSDFIAGSSVNNDVGTLVYDQVRNAGIHAVTSAGGVNYSYDKYGNMIARGGESIIYDTFNKPVRIAGASITDFYYGPDHELYKEVSGAKTTYKLAGGSYEVIVDGSTTTQKSYVDGVIMNNRVLISGAQSANDTVYLHTDHLGSVEATTNALGQFVNRMSFGTWGERQKSDWKPGNPTETFLTTNGYTGHDQLDSHNLVHMGGRVYDPNLGRFLSADIYIQSPYDSQNYNRYSYVGNNPLSYTDPSGYSKSRSFGPGVQDLNFALQQAMESTRTIGNRDAYWDQRIADAIKSSNQQSMMNYMALYGPTGTITAIHGTAFFGVTNIVVGVSPGDAAQQEADVKAAEDFLGTGVVLAAKVVGPGGKAKGAKALATGDAVKAGAKLLRYDGAKPTYHVNPAHVPGGRGFNPNKTPLPKDAESVFKKAVPNDSKNPTAWFGKNSDGQIYRYSTSNDGTAHFSGINGVGDGTRNLTKYAQDRLNGL